MLRHVTFSLSMFFEANTKMVFLKESFFLQLEVHYLQTLKHNFL